MTQSFKGKRALVTGAGKGIGRDLVIKLVQSGAETFALSRTLSDLESLKEEYPSIHIICCDLADTSNIEPCIKPCLPIDFLVNNAGILFTSFVLDTPLDMFDKIMNINLKAPYLISQIVAKDMVNRKASGSIVNNSSVLSIRAQQNTSIYSMAKAAMDQMTRSMALELAKLNIRVNSVLPTAIRTTIIQEQVDQSLQEHLRSKIPIGRFGEVGEVNSLIMFLLSDEASLITGCCIPVDGGTLCAW